MTLDLQALLDVGRVVLALFCGVILLMGLAAVAGLIWENLRRGYYLYLVRTGKRRRPIVLTKKTPPEGGDA